jgi:hypothetical protein
MAMKQRSKSFKYDDEELVSPWLEQAKIKEKKKQRKFRRNKKDLIGL